MTWDHRESYKPFIAFSESQIGEGGQNAKENCVPTSIATIVKALGGPHFEPDDLTDSVYGDTYHGLEDFGPIYDRVKLLWPLAPIMMTSHTGRALADVDIAGEHGNPVAVSFWCDDKVGISRGARAGKHVSPVMAHVDGNLFILNVWGDSIYEVPEDVFEDITSGEAGVVAVFCGQLATQ